MHIVWRLTARNERYTVNKVTKKTLHFFKISQEKPFLKLSVQVMRLKNKDKSAKIKVQGKRQKIPYNLFIKVFQFLL